MAAIDLDWEEVRDQLRTWREDNTRHSEEVVDMWEYCLRHYKHKLGDERWMVEEQVVIAGLDCYRLDVAEPSLVSLSEQFTGSLRVRKLKAMRLEALERFDEAIDVYDSIIRLDETNSTARKRKVAVLRGQGRIADAIKELTEYLKIFMSDGEAWQELCDLYLKEGDYAKAAFCMEELILTNPHNHLFYTRYAEIKYTQGNLDNMEIARSYFCQAAKLNPGNVRALYGLFLSCTQVSSSSKCSAQKKKETQQLAAWALKEIADRYSKCRTKAMDGSKILETFGALSLTDKA
ncbi:ER membrane protein complex subunit 2-like [Homarus americanus]|uniref:ER membrane protein complex subunit 2-like n=1 Tax=Homarus americanus TaxID=6706 RepID=UPI001C47B43D|nr:ER membrane protein complex subunit 2-like [Homarus americanus]